MVEPGRDRDHPERVLLGREHVGPGREGGEAEDGGNRNREAGGPETTDSPPPRRDVSVAPGRRARGRPVLEEQKWLHKKKGVRPAPRGTGGWTLGILAWHGPNARSDKATS